MSEAQARVKVSTQLVRSEIRGKWQWEDTNSSLFEILINSLTTDHQCKFDFSTEPSFVLKSEDPINGQSVGIMYSMYRQWAFEQYNILGGQTLMTSL